MTFRRVNLRQLRGHNKSSFFSYGFLFLCCKLLRILEMFQWQQNENLTRYERTDGLLRPRIRPKFTPLKVIVAQNPHKNQNKWFMPISFKHSSDCSVTFEDKIMIENEKKSIFPQNIFEWLLQNLVSTCCLNNAKS